MDQQQQLNLDVFSLIFNISNINLNCLFVSKEFSFLTMQFIKNLLKQHDLTFTTRTVTSSNKILTAFYFNTNFGTKMFVCDENFNSKYLFSVQQRLNDCKVLSSKEPLTFSEMLNEVLMRNVMFGSKLTKLVEDKTKMQQLPKSSSLMETLIKSDDVIKYLSD